MILTLVRAKRAANEGEIERFCHSIQLVSSRDVDGTITTVVRAMLEESPAEPIGSSELASHTRLNRVTIIHHLQRLEKIGIVEKESHKYRLSPLGFSEFVRRMRQEQEQMLDEAQELAKEIESEYFGQIESAPERKQIAQKISGKRRKNLQ